MVDEKLKFYDHIREKVNKAYSMLGIIKRNFKHTDNVCFFPVFVQIFGKKYCGVQIVQYGVLRIWARLRN